MNALGRTGGNALLKVGWCVGIPKVG
jgi:hypothetical protein